MTAQKAVFIHFECRLCGNPGFRSGWVFCRHATGEAVPLYAQLVCLACGDTSVPVAPPASLVNWADEN